MGLKVWTIYERPQDYPEKFVVREFVVGAKEASAGMPPGTVQPLQARVEPTAVVDTLEEARAAIPTGTVRIRRDATDPYAVVESWV